MWGLCPFHHEKTSSFSVNTDGQFYHCFGCGASGDVINFVKEVEGMDFIDTIKMLGSQVGMQLPEFSGKDDTVKHKEHKDKLLSLMRDTANYYHNNLKLTSAESANQYILSRGMDSSTVKKFGIGYSIGFKEIVSYLRTKGYSEELMYEAGVIDKNDNNNYYDSLAGRLIFPICDAFGQVIAFGGRLLEKKDYAKYKNTKETILFVKNKVLYGLHLVKKIKLKEKLDSIIMVEGYMDLISLNMAGIENVVASMGTALTKEQAKLLKRQVDKVYIAYDGDAAGQKATFRGLDILYTEGLDVRVVSLPNGKDPDDTVKALGVQGFHGLLDKALPLVEYKLKLLEQHFDLKSLEGKGKYAVQAVRVLKSLNNNLEMEAYLDSISELTNINRDTLKVELYSKDNNDSGKMIHNRAINTVKDNTAYQIAEKYILNAMLYNKPYATMDEDLDNVFELEISRLIYNYIKDCVANNRKPIASTALTLSQDSNNALSYIEIDSAQLSEEEQKRYYLDCMKTIKSRYYENRKRELSAQYDNIEDQDKKRELLTEINNLRLKIKNL